MITVNCPECKNIIQINSTPEIGHLVQCGSCQTVLEVTWLYPVSLDYQEQPFPAKDPKPEPREYP